LGWLFCFSVACAANRLILSLCLLVMVWVFF